MLKKIDDCAELVRKETDECWFNYRQHPEEFEHSENVFRCAVLSSVVQEYFSIKVDLSLNDMKPEESFKHPEHFFMHGLLNGEKGMCLPLCVLYAAIGRRLGYPLKLVTTAEHMFVRWDDGGERFNVESAIEGFATRPDSHYLEWPKKVEEKDANRYGFLLSMTPARELSSFLFHRGCCLSSDPQKGVEAVECILWAHGLTPDDPTPIATAMQVMHVWRIGLTMGTPVWFPDVRIKFSPRRRFRYLPLKIEQEYLRLSIVTKIMQDTFGGGGASVGKKLAELPDRIFVNCE